MEPEIKYGTFIDALTGEVEVRPLTEEELSVMTNDLDEDTQPS